MEKNVNSTGNYLKLDPSITNTNNEFISEKDVELLEDNNNENTKKTDKGFNSPVNEIANGPETLEILDNNENEETKINENTLIIADNDNKKVNGKYFIKIIKSFKYR